MKKVFLFNLLIMTFLLTKSQSLTRYKDVKGNLYAKQSIDSIIEAKNIKLKDLGMTARIEILNNYLSGDTLVYNYKLNITTAGVDSNDLKKNKFLNEVLPGFIYTDINGNIVNSKKLYGKPIIINLWFTTCLPCIAEMPELNKLKEKYKNTDLVFLAMTYEPKASVTSFLKSKKFNFDIIPDAKEYCDKITNDYPVNLFVDRNGIIKTIQNGMPFKYNSVTKTHSSNVDPSEFENALLQIK